MQCTSLIINLHLPKYCRRLDTCDGVNAHKTLLATITKCDSEFGREVHDIQHIKPFTLAFIRSDLRLTFIGTSGITMMNHVLSEFVSGTVINVGNNRCIVKGIALDETYAPAVSTMADLCAPTIHQKFTIIFRTETAINMLNSRGRRYMKLFPDPELVFTRLANYWQEYTDQVIPDWYFECLADGGIGTSQHKIKTLYFRQKNRHQNGFRGSASYECLEKDDEFVMLTNTLCRFAPYVGIGVQTARGMGAVSVSFLD